MKLILATVGVCHMLMQGMNSQAMTIAITIHATGRRTYIWLVLMVHVYVNIPESVSLCPPKSQNPKIAWHSLGTDREMVLLQQCWEEWSFAGWGRADYSAAIIYTEVETKLREKSVAQKINLLPKHLQFHLQPFWCTLSMWLCARSLLVGLPMLQRTKAKTAALPYYMES